MAIPRRTAVTNAMRRWRTLWQRLTRAAEVRLQYRQQQEQAAIRAAWLAATERLAKKAQDTRAQQRQQERKQVSAHTGNGARYWLLNTLSPPRIGRISIDFGGGVGIAVAAGLLIASGWPIVAIAVISLLGTFFAIGLISLFLEWLVAATRGSLLRHTILRHPLRSLLIIIGAIFILLVFMAALPAVFVLVFGIWACLLTHRRARASRHRWMRCAPDVLAAALTGLDLLVLFDRDLLTTVPAAGLLFPIGVWLSIRAWGVMSDSERPALRAGADIALSLLLGADLVLVLVWGANLLDLSEAEIAILRSTLERIGSIADLPWPLWVGLYVLFATTSLVFALRPEGLTTIIRWAQRLPIVPSINAIRRILSGVHIGLLVAVLIAVSAPASLEAALRAPLKAKYTVALQRELESRGELAAYEEIRRQFTADTNASASPSAQPVTVIPLSTIVDKIHSIAGPPPGASDATSTERDLARRLGQLQATTLQLVATHSVLSADQAVTDLARFDPPVRGTGDLDDRLHRLDAEQHQADTAIRLANQVGELAATAVANMIQIPGFGENEIVQVIREYLSGLVENSPLKEVFAAWAERLTGSNTTPPPADTMVVPDPERLEQTALTTLTQEKVRVQLADPSTPDQAEASAQTESPADAAVDLVNEARYLDQHTGPCDGCPQPGPPGEEHYKDHYKGPGDVPGEPVEPVEPHIRIPIIGW